MSRFRFVAAFAALALTIAAVPAPSLAETQYVYDSAGRLIKVTYSNGVSIEYRYDASGNRQVITTARVANRAPAPIADSASVLASGTIDIPVLTNDTDPDRDPLTITGVSAVTGGGAATLLTNPQRIRFVAPASAGTKTFTYTISDGQGHTASTTVAVTVTSTNQPPVANPDDASATPSSSTSIMVLANDTDPNNNTLTVTAVGAPTGGSVAIGSGGGYVVYTSPGIPGTYTFSYTVSDGAGGSASTTVTVVVESLEGCVPGPMQQCGIEP